MLCNTCGFPQNNIPNKDFTKSVIEINNPDKIVLLRKVVLPASMGTEENVPPTIGKYYNVILQYESNGHTYIYSSDGIPTSISSDVDTLEEALEDEKQERQNADEEIRQEIADINELLDGKQNVLYAGAYIQINSNVISATDTTYTAGSGLELSGTTFSVDGETVALKTDIPTTTSELTNNGENGQSVYVEANELATVATSGSYNDLSNKPTLPVVPTNVSAFNNDANYQTATQVQSAIATETSARENADEALDTRLTTVEGTVSTALQPSSIDRVVMSDINVGQNASTTSVQIDASKVNLLSGATSTKNVPLPVASSTQAGVMNAATFTAVSNNTNNINAILNGAVAVSDLPESPTQEQLTDAWKDATGLSSLINSAEIYDVTNEKVWTYFTNTSVWYASSNSVQVTVNTFTNSSEGVIKGSTNDGQVFAENDGTGSVNGWDDLSSQVENNTSAISANTADIESNTQTLASHTQSITTNTQNIASNTQAISTNTQNISQNAQDIGTLETTVSGHTQSLSSLSTSVSGNSQDIEELQDLAASHTQSISTLNSSVETNTQNISSLTSSVNSNTQSIGTLETTVSNHTQSINSLNSSVSSVEQDISGLESSLSGKQDTLIAGNNIQISGNTISATNQLPTGGTAGQILTKVDGTDYNVEWSNATENVFVLPSILLSVGEHTIAFNGEEFLSVLASEGSVVIRDEYCNVPVSVFTGVDSPAHFSYLNHSGKILHFTIGSKPPISTLTSVTVTVSEV